MFNQLHCHEKWKKFFFIKNLENNLQEPNL